MSKHSNTPREEHRQLGKVYPGNVALARRHLQLSREIRERAFELDPTLRPAKPAAIATDSAPMALDAATENAIIERALRAARQSSAPRRSTSTKVTSSMRRSSNGYSAKSLFQRTDSRDLGPAFAAAWQRRNDSPRPKTAHALDEESHVDRDEALKHLDRLRNHVDVRAGTAEYDSKYVSDSLSALLRALQVDNTEEPEGDERGDDHTDELPDPGASGGPMRVDRKRAKDAGETPARSVVNNKGAKRELDHRADFNSIAQGGAEDSADFDPPALFQR